MQKHLTMTDILRSIEAYLLLVSLFLSGDFSFAVLYACGFWWSEYEYNFSLPTPSVGRTKTGALVV